MAAVMACPTCGKRALRPHCPESVSCTWRECAVCFTLLDVRTGKHVARMVREKGAD